MLSFLTLVVTLFVSTSLPVCHSVCLPCYKEVCLGSAQNCTLVPAVTCPETNHCRAGVVKDKCGCCNICAKLIGEKCHEEPASFEWQGGCARGLKCVAGLEGTAATFEGLQISNHVISRCEPASQECRDPVTGISYRAGALWSHGNFACATCVCSRDGRPTCSRITCNNPECGEDKRLEGRCCAFCVKEDWDRGCRFNGEAYFINEVIVLPDHHTVCKCRGSEWSCTAEIHKQFLPLTEKPLCVNSVNGEPYQVGEIWKPSDCAQCMCGKNGRGQCSSVKCQQPGCDRPIKLRDRCCPVCPQDYFKVCHYNQQKYLPGESIALVDRCSLCTCDNASWRCSSEPCTDSKYIREPISLNRG